MLAEDEADRESQRAQVEGTLRAEIARDSDLGGELGPEFGQTMDERQVKRWAGQRGRCRGTGRREGGGGEGQVVGVRGSCSFLQPRACD